MTRGQADGCSVAGAAERDEVPVPESVFPEATLTLEVQATGVRVVMETEGGAMISISPAMLVMYEGRLQVVR